MADTVASIDEDLISQQTGVIGLKNFMNTSWFVSFSDFLIRIDW